MIPAEHDHALATEATTETELVTQPPEEVTVSPLLLMHNRPRPKHPRLFNALWFSGFGAVSGVIWTLAVFSFTGIFTGFRDASLEGVLTGLFMFSVPGAIAAFAAALAMSPRILTEKDITESQAGEYGVYVATWANFALGAVYGIPGGIGLGISLSAGTLWAILLIPFIAIGITAAAGIGCAIATGLVTIPMGRVAGKQMWRRYCKRPSGCQLHGYREAQPKLSKSSD